MTVIKTLMEERKHQIAKGYDAAHDDAHTPRELLDELLHRLHGCHAVDASYDRGGPADYPVEELRQRLIQVAAVAVAIIESLDRRDRASRRLAR